MERDSHKGRVRRVPLIRSLLLSGAIAAAWYYGSRAMPAATCASAVNAEQDSIQQPAAQESPRHIATHVIRSGDTFLKVLTNLGIPDREAIACYEPLRTAGLSAIYPGDSLILSTSESNSLKSLSLLSGLRNWYHLTADDDGLRAEKWVCARSTHRAVVKGTLETCLSEDLSKYGVGDALVCQIADIFAWDINFFVDPRKGDRFEVLFEKTYVEGRSVGYGDILAAKYTNNGHTYYAIGMRDSDGRLCYYGHDGKSVQKQFLKAPLRYRRISSGYTYRRRHPVLGIVRPHLGIDYAAPRGTPVYAAADGKVASSGPKGQFGRHVRLSHGGAYETYYGHLHTIASNVRAGARVRQGEMIGTVGSSGLSTGPHLDYRMKRHGQFVNPQTVVLPSKEGVGAEEIDGFLAQRTLCLMLLEQRFEQDGCYTVDIGLPQGTGPEKVVTVAGTETGNGNGISARDDS